MTQYETVVGFACTDIAEGLVNFEVRNVVETVFNCYIDEFACMSITSPMFPIKSYNDYVSVSFLPIHPLTMDKRQTLTTQLRESLFSSIPEISDVDIITEETA